MRNWPDSLTLPAKRTPLPSSSLCGSRLSGVDLADVKRSAAKQQGVATTAMSNRARMDRMARPRGPLSLRAPGLAFGEPEDKLSEAISAVHAYASEVRLLRFARNDADKESSGLSACA